MQLRSIVDRRENELASHAKWPILGEKMQSWAKKRNPGRKTRVFGTFPERSYRKGGGTRENFLGLAGNSFARQSEFQENRSALERAVALQYACCVY